MSTLLNHLKFICRGIDIPQPYPFEGRFNWSKIKKLTKSSSESEILDAFQFSKGTDSNYVILTKQELLSKLSNAAVFREKFRDGVTYDDIRVSYTGSSYVIYIYGIKIAAEDGKLVGTPSVRMITISDETSGDLSVLKAPTEDTIGA